MELNLCRHQRAGKWPDPLVRHKQLDSYTGDYCHYALNPRQSLWWVEAMNHALTTSKPRSKSRIIAELAHNLQRRTGLPSVYLIIRPSIT